MTNDTPVLDDPYEVVLVRRSETPPGAEGTDWYRYEIVQGKNRIKGYRRGSREDVTEAVSEIATRLNERRSGKRGRVKLTAPQKKQQPTAPPAKKKTAAPQAKKKTAAPQAKKKPAAQQKRQQPPASQK